MRALAPTLERFDPPPPPAARRAPPAAPAVVPTPETETETGAEAPRAAAEALEARLARARGEGRAEGFAAGVAEAEARGAAALRVLLSQIAEGIGDLRVTREEHEARLGRAVAEIGEALLSGVAPAFARAGLAREAAAALAAALAEGRPAASPPRVRVSPAQAGAVRTEFDAAGLAAEVVAAPDLGDLEARIDWPDGGEAVDLDAAVEAARAVLDRHLSNQRRRVANG